MKNKVYAQLTNGFGNNIFQYAAARLLGEFHNLDVVVVPPTPDYYAIPSLEALGLKVVEKPESELFVVNDNNYSQAFKRKHSCCNFLVSGYFENYKYYVEAREKIKSWFPRVENRNSSDLVVHVRTGDRLFYKNEFYTKPKVEAYIEAIRRFNFRKLYIVTDLPEWKSMTEAELQKLSFHVNVPSQESVPIRDSALYINSLVNGLSRLDPIVKNRTIVEDFNFMRSFDNILFEHSTLGWWASFLSGAVKVGVYGPWRPWKGSCNKNLANVPLEGWFQWQ